MKKLFLTLIVTVILISTQAQYQRLKLFIDDAKFLELQTAGIALDHGVYKRGHHFTGEFSASEIELIKDSEVYYEVLVSDLESYYSSNRSNEKDLSEYPCEEQGFVPADPENFSLGSMGGYYTYEEYLANLDSMASLYPTLISVKQVIDTFLTHENRPLYWVKISDNPTVDETDEAEVLYTSIHHAREPASLSQNIYYMWYLLENYNSDTSIQGLINSTEMYFIPVINPDGYIFNEINNPNGGGMWRKNRRDNDGNDYNIGVDLNRNYGYEWGGLGASVLMESDIYRGPSAFSEPETQAIKYFCENHEFVFALNYHTHGNLLLYPFGYDTYEYTEDHDLFGVLTEEMTSYNNYDNILSSGLYPASGDSDDWMYAGDIDNKPKIMAMTPEVGDEFWPPSSDINALCQENVYQSLMAARLSGAYAKVYFNGSTGISTNEIDLPFIAKRLGVADGSFTIEFESESEGVEIIGANNFDFTNPESLDTMEISLSVSIDDNVVNGGDELTLNVYVNNGSYSEMSSYSFIYGTYSSVFSDDCESMGAYIHDGWGLSNEDSYTPFYSITDSPYEEYEDNINSTIQLLDLIDLTGEVFNANLTFWAKWEIESGWDYAQVLGSIDGSTWTPLCGNYTHAGTSNQDEDQPLYDGSQSTWIMETINLDDYIGEEVYLSFRLITDEYVTDDGFYFDDISVNVISEELLGIENNKKAMWKVYPNPVNNILHVRTDDMGADHYELIDGLGRLVQKEKISDVSFMIETNQLEDGLYILRLVDQDYVEQIKIQVIHH